MKVPVHLGVLLSGGGRTLQNLLDRIEDGSLAARVEVVVSSHPDAQGLERARKKGIPAHVVNYREFPDPESFSLSVTQALRRHAVDLVVMGGFIRKYLIPPEYEGRVLNIHPALLPKHGGRGFYGHRVHEAVLAAGEKESGCTVHFADDRYDQGQVILQKRVPVLPGDTPETLAERVFQAECEAYPEAIEQVAGRAAKSKIPTPKSQ